MSSRVWPADIVPNWPAKKTKSCLLLTLGSERLKPHLLTTAMDINHRRQLPRCLHGNPQQAHRTSRWMSATMTIDPAARAPVLINNLDCHLSSRVLKEPHPPRFSLFSFFFSSTVIRKSTSSYQQPANHQSTSININQHQSTSINTINKHHHQPIHHHHGFQQLPPSRLVDVDLRTLRIIIKLGRRISAAGALPQPFKRHHRRPPRDLQQRLPTIFALARNPLLRPPPLRSAAIRT